MTGAHPRVETNSRWIGSSTTTPAGCERRRRLPRRPCSERKSCRGPGRGNARGAASSSLHRRCNCLRQAAPPCTPRGSLSSDDSSARKVPVDEDQLTRLRPATATGSSCLRRDSAALILRQPKCECRAIAETFVKRQSSSCVVGKPTSQKRAKASRRRSTQPRQFPSRGAPLELAEALKVVVSQLQLQ